MEALLALLPSDEQLLAKVSKDSLAALHAMLSWHSSPALRHLAFVALMRLGRQAPTLYRKDEEHAHDASQGMDCSHHYDANTDTGQSEVFRRQTAVI